MFLCNEETIINKIKKCSFCYIHYSSLFTSLCGVQYLLLFILWLRELFYGILFIFFNDFYTDFPTEYNTYTLLIYPLYNSNRWIARNRTGTGHHYSHIPNTNTQKTIYSTTRCFFTILRWVKTWCIHFLAALIPPSTSYCISTDFTCFLFTIIFLYTLASDVIKLMAL